jgi:hypothetical protein
MYGGDVQGEGDVPRARPVRAVQSRLGRSPDPTCTEAGRGKQIETQVNPSSDVESSACRRVAVLARPQTDRAPLRVPVVTVVQRQTSSLVSCDRR